jgi:UDP-N-acetylglucosamine transferase subunit ALG13
MIFLTLGTQLAFERLVRRLDEAAAVLEEPVFGQIGPSSYTPKHMEHTDYLTPPDFRARFAAARVIVGHAGMGTILSAKAGRKPLLIMARKAALGEHRNDHQIATLQQMSRIPGVHPIGDDTDLVALLTDETLEAMSDAETPARAALVERLRKEVGIG